MNDDTTQELYQAIKELAEKMDECDHSTQAWPQQLIYLFECLEKLQHPVGEWLRPEYDGMLQSLDNVIRARLDSGIW
jgi:hypothetical protein